MLLDARKRIQEGHEVPVLIDDLLTYWQSISDSCGPGCIDLKLDEYLSDERSVRCFLQLLDMVEKKIGTFGDMIPGEYLTSLVGSPATVFVDMPAKDVHAILNSVRSLFGGGTGRN